MAAIDFMPAATAAPMVLLPAITRSCRSTTTERPARYFSERFLEKFAPALRASVRVLLIKNQLRDRYGANLRLHVPVPFSEAEECSDFCQGPYVQMATSAHIRPQSLREAKP